ncbi:hypothetical protein Hanom_Chr16g01486031 [Helianthus anomalus]
MTVAPNHPKISFFHCNSLTTELEGFHHSVPCLSLSKTIDTIICVLSQDSHNIFGCKTLRINVCVNGIQRRQWGVTLLPYKIFKKIKY